jgi:type II secretory pathway pseudopilin PulG
MSRWARLRAHAGDDAGFTLAETMVAALVLALFSAAVGGVILNTLKVGQLNRERVAASSLAAREMEIVRDRFQRIDRTAGNSNPYAKQIVDAGLVTDPNPLTGTTNVLDGVAYTVKRSAFWEPKGTGVSACDGGAAVNYPSVHVYVTVTWPNMGSVRPVTTDSVLTPNKSLLNTAYSFVAVKVLTFAGQANPGRTVTATGPAGTLSEVTDSSGCAVFGLSSAGDYTFGLQEPGYVDFAGNSAPAKPATVSAGTFQQVQFTYDRAGEIDVTLSTDAGYALPTTLPDIGLGNQSLPAPGTLVYAAAGSVTALANLGPYQNGYTVWGGGCTDANPAGSPTSGQLTPIVLGPGARVSATAMLAPVDVDAPTFPGATVYATKTGDATCPAGQDVLTLGVTDAAGALATSLPYGTWILTTSAGGTSAAFRPTQAGPSRITVA